MGASKAVGMLGSSKADNASTAAIFKAAVLGETKMAEHRADRCKVAALQGANSKNALSEG